MARIIDNDLLIDATFTPPADEEPQLIFRNDTEGALRRRISLWPKAESRNALAPRRARPLGQFPMERWDLPRPRPAKDAGLFQMRDGWPG